MISIEMITKNDDNINISINAILNQEVKDYEIIIVDSSNENHYKEYENISGLKYIHESNSNFLKARLTANNVAEGDYVLLLDSTRIINKDLLTECINLIKTNDMIIIPEKNVSKSRILQDNSPLTIDSDNILSNCNPVNGIFLPRFYKKKLLDESFKKVLMNLNKIEIDHICSLEDRMLYIEASNLSKKIGVCKNYLTHRESNSLLSYIKKYYNYGKCNYYVFSKISNYSFLGNPNVKRRNRRSFTHNNSLQYIILFSIRSISFFFGFLLAI